MNVYTLALRGSQSKYLANANNPVKQQRLIKTSTTIILMNRALEMNKHFKYLVAYDITVHS